jgi:hypothetical protein
MATVEATEFVFASFIVGRSSGEISLKALLFGCLDNLDERQGERPIFP